MRRNLKEAVVIEKTVFRMLSDTSFVYGKLGLESFYGTIARIEIMDKTTERMKDGEEIKTESRSIFITDIEDITVEVLYKIKAAHWSGDAALDFGYTA